MRSFLHSLFLSLALFFSVILFLSLSLLFFPLILPLSSVEERTLEALGAMDERYHEDVGQRGFDGHEDLVARGEREVRGRGLRRRGRHLASSLKLSRASVRVSWRCVVWCELCAFRFAPLRPSRPRGASGSSRAAVVVVVVSCAAPLRAATHRPLFLSLSLFSLSLSLVHPLAVCPNRMTWGTTAAAMCEDRVRRAVKLYGQGAGGGVEVGWQVEGTFNLAAHTAGCAAAPGAPARAGGGSPRQVCIQVSKGPRSALVLTDEQCYQLTPNFRKYNVNMITSAAWFLCDYTFLFANFLFFKVFDSQSK